MIKSPAKQPAHDPEETVVQVFLIGTMPHFVVIALSLSHHRIVS